MPTILLFDHIPTELDSRGTCYAALVPSRSRPGTTHLVRFDRFHARNQNIYLCDCEAAQKSIHVCPHVAEAIRAALDHNVITPDVPQLEVFTGGRSA